MIGQQVKAVNAAFPSIGFIFEWSFLNSGYGLGRWGTG
jgi:hypothetical protein